MAAARKKSVAPSEIESVDLISLLTVPGSEGIYEAEIAIPDEDDYADIPAIEATETRTDDLDSLTAMMGATSANPVRQPEKTDAGQIEPTKISAEKRPLAEKIEIVENDSLERIAQEVSQCQKCQLCQTRNKTVPGVGSGKADLVFIGEAPGADEDASGIPFVGKAGRHLDKILTAAGISREEVFICNVLKCRPPNNRNPQLSEMVSCTPFLQRQLQLIRPKLIACLGNVAIRYVIAPDTPGITKIHGQWFNSIFSIPTMAMYHPSYLIRSESREKGSPNWQMWQDIQKLKKRYDEVRG
ncbi:MAG: uracil-DNA glycosylase [Clostridiales bacterium]|jgi:DNA polymerase|nr:uracil-DNA glycosylase [Clostridiales bacterium]MDN5283719.1 uracil-DNA glycosylase [Candidatus Ozemobacter sp.]